MQGITTCKGDVDGAPELLTYTAIEQKVRDSIAATGAAAVVLLAELEKTGAVAS